MKRRTVIGVQPPSPEEMAWLDKQAIDPMNTEQVGLLAAILNVNAGNPHDAIAAVGPKVRDIRKHLAEMPRARPPSRFRRRR